MSSLKNTWWPFCWATEPFFRGEEWISILPALSTVDCLYMTMPLRLTKPVSPLGDTSDSVHKVACSNAAQKAIYTIDQRTQNTFRSKPVLSSYHLGNASLYHRHMTRIKETVRIIKAICLPCKSPALRTSYSDFSTFRARHRCDQSDQSCLLQSTTNLHQSIADA